MLIGLCRSPRQVENLAPHVSGPFWKHIIKYLLKHIYTHWQPTCRDPFGRIYEVLKHTNTHWQPTTTCQTLSWWQYQTNKAFTFVSTQHSACYWCTFVRGWAETKTKVGARTEILVLGLGLQEIPAYQLKLPGRKQKELLSLHLFQKVKTKSWLYFRKGNSTFCFHFLK